MAATNRDGQNDPLLVSIAKRPENRVGNMGKMLKTLRESEGGSVLSKDAKWLISVILIVALPVIGFLGRQSLEISSMQTSFSSMEVSVEKLTDTVTQLMTQDMADVKSRVAVIESRGILPVAERKIEDIDRRLREVENRTK